MANTKTIKRIKMAKTKCENLNDFLINIVNWQEIAKVLNYSKTSTFRIRKKLKEYIQSTSDEDALYKAFSVSELNLLIDLYNDYVKNPEDYAKPKTKKEIDIERQEKAIEKHMKDMKMDYKSENRE
jgi:AraC-like DNA-binding protein